mgnify:CR=1 FL=1
MRKRYTIWIFALIMSCLVVNVNNNTYATNNSLYWGENTSTISPNKSVVYPNPVKNKAVVRFYNPKEKVHRLEIYDLIGNKVKVYTDVRATSFDIEVRDMEAGMYFYFIMNDTERISTGRLFVRN